MVELRRVKRLCGACLPLNHTERAPFARRALRCQVVVVGLLALGSWHNWRCDYNRPNIHCIRSSFSRLVAAAAAEQQHARHGAAAAAAAPMPRPEPGLLLLLRRRSSSSGPPALDGHQLRLAAAGDPGGRHEQVGQEPAQHRGPPAVRHQEDHRDALRGGASPPLGRFAATAPAVPDPTSLQPAAQPSLPPSLHPLSPHCRAGLLHQEGQRSGGEPFAFFDSLSPEVTTHQNFDELLIPTDHVSRGPSSILCFQHHFPSPFSGSPTHFVSIEPVAGPTDTFYLSDSNHTSNHQHNAISSSDLSSSGMYCKL